MTICIIPARSGSKRIKNKNIKLFNGKPIISHAINLAKKSGLFKRIIVSTDSKKIAKIARKYGAEVPFLRSKRLSDDYTNTAEVLIDAIKKISSETTKYHFCIYPTTTLVSKLDLIKSFKKIKREKSNLLIAITDFDKSPYRALKLIGKKNIKFYFKKFASYRTQDVPKLYQDSGSFYIHKTEALIKNGGKLSNKSIYYYLNRYKAVDIDNEINFKFAEFLYRGIKN